MPRYFAYGSNLHPLRLIERVPSASLVGVIELTKHRLLFHKHSTDGSSKCTLVHTSCDANLIYGAIYDIDQAHKPDLAHVEGKGCGYLDHQLSLQHRGRAYTCFTYLAQPSYIGDHVKPYHWYKQLVILGAKYLKFPDSYIHSIASVESVEDPEENRRIENEMLIQNIINYSN